MDMPGNTGVRYSSN